MNNILNLQKIETAQVENEEATWSTISNHCNNG